MAEVRAFHALHADFEEGPDLSRAHRRVRDPEPAIYQLRQSFEHGGRTLARRGIVAALGLSTSGASAVLPHEPPDPQAVRRRLQQIATSRIFDGPLLVLYPGDLGDAESPLALERERRADAWSTGEDGSRLELWRLTERKLLAHVTSALSERRLYLADGQNRHDAAVAWAERCQVAGAKESGPQRFALACLVSFDDPGLTTVPVHRLVRELPLPDPERLAVLLDEHFEVELLPEDLEREAGLLWTQRRLADASHAGHAFVILTRADRRARLLRLKEGVDLAHVGAIPRNPSLRAVDLALFTALVLRHTLGLAPEGEQVERTTSAREVVRSVLGEGRFALGALLAPTPPWQVRSVADAGERLPPHAALFVPPVPEGLLASTVDPAGEL